MRIDMEKRTFGEIRLLLLAHLLKGQKTINTLARESGVNWKTVDNHIIYLLGKGFAKEILSSPYARIVEISEKGKEHLQIKYPKGKIVFLKKQNKKGGLLIQT